MTCREEVIKGLKLCATGSECTGRDCPYWHNVLDDAIKGCDCTTELVRDALALLKEQEAVVQKTGHWIFESACCEAFWSHTCSECGKRMTTGYDTYANYCWNCGAKMEGLVKQ